MNRKNDQVLENLRLEHGQNIETVVEHVVRFARIELEEKNRRLEEINRILGLDDSDDVIEILRKTKKTLDDLKNDLGDEGQRINNVFKMSDRLFEIYKAKFDERATQSGADLEQVKADLADAVSKKEQALEEAEQSLKEARQANGQARSARQERAQAKAELAQAKDELAQAKAELAQAKAELERVTVLAERVGSLEQENVQAVEEAIRARQNLAQARQANVQDVEEVRQAAAEQVRQANVRALQAGQNLEQVQAALNDAIIAGRRAVETEACLLYTSPSPRDLSTSRMPSSA